MTRDVSDLRAEAVAKRRTADMARRVSLNLSVNADRVMMLQQAQTLEAEAAGLDAQAAALEAQASN